MKKLILFLLLITQISFAQNNIVIHLDGQTADISGQTHTVVAPSGDSFDVPFDVVNNTGSSAQWRISRKQLNLPTGWTDALCWGHSTDPFGGTCYSSGQMNSNPWTTPGSQAVLFAINDGEYGKMKVSIDVEDNTFGQAHYRYYITTNGLTMLDSVDLVVDYLAAVKPFGIVVAMGFMAGTEVKFDIRNFFFSQKQIRGTLMADIEDLQVWLEQVRAGVIKTVVDTVLPLSEAAKAHELVATNKAKGAVILMPWAY